MGATLLTLFLGGVGWWITHFVAEPVKRIYDQRRQAQEELIAFGNVGDAALQKERSAASAAYRKTGAGLLASQLAAYPWVNWWFQTWCINLKEGGTAMLALSTLMLEDPERKPGPARLIRRHRAEKALKLPLTLSDESVRQACEQMAVFGQTGV